VPILLPAVRLYPGSAALGAPQDPWTQAQVIRPEQLDKELSKAQKLTLINVAFRVLYQNGHIPGSPYFGAGRDPKAIENLKQWAKSVA